MQSPQSQSNLADQRCGAVARLTRFFLSFQLDGERITVEASDGGQVTVTLSSVREFFAERARPLLRGAGRKVFDVELTHWLSRAQMSLIRSSKLWDAW